MGLCLDHLSVNNLSFSFGYSQSEFPTEWNPWKPEAFLRVLQVPPGSLPSLAHCLQGASCGDAQQEPDGQGALFLRVLDVELLYSNGNATVDFHSVSFCLRWTTKKQKKENTRERTTLFFWPASYPGMCMLPMVDIKAVKAYCQINSAPTETGETRSVPWKTLNLAPPWWFAKFNFCNGLWWQRHSLFFQQELLNVWMTHSVGGRYNGSLRYPDLRVGRLCGRGGMGYTLS